jgi:hypothetical protein
MGSLYKNMEFRLFLFEQANAVEQSNLQEIISRLRAQDWAWLTEKGIDVKNAGDQWVLNYKQTEKPNEFSRKTRGMVIDKATGRILSYPMERFFNRHEAQADAIDFSNSEMLEKLDGTMVGVAFPNGDPKKPIWHTRKMLSSHLPDVEHKITSFRGKSYQFLPLIGQYVKALPFTLADTEFTYVFEFIHEASAVITKYRPEHYGLYLIAARNLKTHREMSEEELDTVANRLGIRRPRRWKATEDQAEIDAMMEREVPNFEGFIFRDRKTGKRVKLKSADYVKLHHLLDKLSYKDLVPLILTGEESEVLSYFPEARDSVDKIKQTYKDYLDKTTSAVVSWANKGLPQDELVRIVFGRNPLKKWEIKLKQMRGEKVETAKQAVDDNFLASMIVSYAQLKDATQIRAAIDKELRQLALGQGTNAGSPKKFLNVIGMKNVEADEPANVGEI